MNRREARENAIGFIFESDFRTSESKEDIFASSCDVREIHDDDFMKSLYFGVMDNIEAIDKAIAENSHGWKLDRISNVSRAVLRLGVYEVLFTDVPDSVAVNESVELIKKLDDDKARPFVNGILNSVMKSKNNSEANGSTGATE